MTSKGKLARIQRAKERNNKIEKSIETNILRLRNESELSKYEKNFGITHWDGYPMGNINCHCGCKTFITGRGTLLGWSGINCCSCGNLIENCACKNGLPNKEIVKNIIDNTTNRIIYLGSK